MALIIEIRTGRKNGLETHTIHVNGVALNTFLSLQQAETRKQQYLYAWNVEKVGNVAQQRKPKAA